MADPIALPRRLIVLGLVLPLAVLVGYLLVSPDIFSVAFLGVVVMVLMLPIVLKWHHPLLVFSWNLPMIIFFLPGSPPAWMVVAAISMAITTLGLGLDKNQKMLHVPALTWAMVAWVLVVLFTMKATGSGLGLRSLGGNLYGGKKYFYILVAIVAYFALSARRVPVAKANAYLVAFVVSGLATVLVNLAYSLGPAFWNLYYLFSVDLAMSQAVEDFTLDPTSTRLGRIGGLATAGSAAFAFMLARYGVTGIFDWSKPWRLVLFLAITCASMFGGFRSTFIALGTMFALQFFFEGLHRTRLLIVLLLGGILGGAALVPFADKLPLSIQRSMTVLPIPLDLHPAVRVDAESSSEWRLRMWNVVLPEVPNYLWIGKGYTTSATDHYLAYQSMLRGKSQDFETSLIAGDYHSGPLSVIIPFGIWGVLAYLLLIGFGFRVLWNNYRHGDPALWKVNVFLISSFVTKTIVFLGVFGAIHADFVAYAGFLGLSVAINGGECRSRQEPGPETQPAPMPPTRPAPFFPGRGLARR